jgi:hypothetical protein
MIYGNLSREEWIARCTARYVERGGVEEADARGFAETSWDEELYREYPPEDAADEDMSYWGD